MYIGILRYDTWTGGEYYWIDFSKGTYRVLRDIPDSYEVMFVGNYNDCKRWIDNEVFKNYEYDHDI